jgi:endonuclease YncB( thermonuclease family)
MATSLRGGADRADELRRTRLYREAFNMYRRVGATRPSLFLGIALAGALFATPTAAIEFVGKVVGVTDGDTLTVLTAQRQQHRVRLSGIDTPERRQAFGQVSKQHLSDLAYDKTVSVVFHKRDRYQRIVGKVLVNGADAGLDQIETGMAWHFKRYEREQLPEDRVAYTRAEETARTEAARSLARSEAGAAVGVPQALKDVRPVRHHDR